MTPLWIVGGGGHAKVVIDAARNQGVYDVIGVLDDDPDTWGSQLLGVPVAGGIGKESIARFAIAHVVIAIGDSRVRKRIDSELATSVSFATIVHSHASIGQHVILGEGTVVMAGAVVQPATAIGRHVVLNTLCGVDHDSNVEDFAHIAPGAHLAGGTSIGAGAFIGMGANVLPGVRVGAWSTIGAGGVVTRDVLDDVTAVGVPVQMIRNHRHTQSD